MKKAYVIVLGLANSMVSGFTAQAGAALHEQAFEGSSGSLLIPDLVLDTFGDVEDPAAFPLVSTVANPAPLLDEDGLTSAIAGHRTISWVSLIETGNQGEARLTIDPVKGRFNASSTEQVTPFGGIVWFDSTAPDLSLDIDLTSYRFFALDYVDNSDPLALFVNLSNLDANGNVIAELRWDFEIDSGSGTQMISLSDAIANPTFGSGDFDLTKVGAVLLGFEGQAAAASFSFEQVFFTSVETLLGDYNGNGEVDAADYTVWADNFGSTVDLAADGNGNGVIDAADYTVWADNFGTGAPASQGVGAIPEPSSLALLSIIGAGLSLRRCRG